MIDRRNFGCVAAQMIPPIEILAHRAAFVNAQINLILAENHLPPVCFGGANGKAHLPAPTEPPLPIYNHRQQMQKAAIQRSAEGAGQVQRLVSTPAFVTQDCP